MDEYISISEFAKRAGVSRPTVYSRLDGDLSNFCKTVKGQKAINVKALSLFGVKKTVKETVKETVKDFTTIDALKGAIDLQRQQLEMLQKQLELKDNQIASLNDRLAETTAALQAAQQSAQAAQALHAGTMQQLLESPKKRLWPWSRKKHSADPDQ